MARARQPFRQVGNLPAEARSLQDSILEWIVRQWATVDRPFGTPTAVQHSDYGAKFSDLVLCDASAAGITVWLPKITEAQIGGAVSVKDIVGTTNLVTVRPSGAGETIGDAAVVELAEWAGSTFVALTPLLWGQM